MPEPLLHIVFGESAAATLRQALADDGRADQIACLRDDFSRGPIAQGDAADRPQWAEDELGVTNWDDIFADTPYFLERSCASGVIPVAWISRRDARNYAGFLWWLSHLGDAPCSIIDVTDLTSDVDTRLVVSPSSLSLPEMRGLLGREMPLTKTDRVRYQAQWQKLTAENAPLRVVDQHGSLLSAPIDHFDPILLDCAEAEWRKMAWIVGGALMHFWDDGLSQSGDILLRARLWDLAEAGKLEWRGDLYAGMMDCELRLPADRSPS